MTTGGHLVVRCLEAQGVDRVFCVPGESYLEILDGLHDSRIETVTARHEGGAAMMAEADGKLTGRPGIVMVTRGPGAANASAGVHVAQQDSTPLILFVGQVARGMIGRDAFQEVDYRGFYGGMAKAVIQIDAVRRIPEVISRAFHLAMAGRPGPVVIPVPEDMLRDDAGDAVAVPRAESAAPAPASNDVDRFIDLLEGARRPLLLAGGSRWTPGAAEALVRFAEERMLPVACEFRRQALFDPLHDHYAGDVGLGVNPRLAERVREADLLILLGGRLPETVSNGYTLVDVPRPAGTLVHVHPDPGELGRVYAASLQINATPSCFLDAVNARPAVGVAGAGELEERVARARRDYLAWSTPDPDPRAAMDPAHVIRWLRENLPADAIVTNGAGNHTQWLHRYYHYRRFGTQLAPTSGSMGYGLPAAIAAKLRHPDRTVVCVTGDGCFQMTAMELATAAQFSAGVVILLFDNGMHGTIRMHQERSYPGRVTATRLLNPDFAALARSCGAHAERVESSDAFGPAFERAAASGRPALIHIVMEPGMISPTSSLAGSGNPASESA